MWQKSSAAKNAIENDLIFHATQQPRTTKVVNQAAKPNLNIC